MPTAFDSERSHRRPARATGIVVGLLTVCLLCVQSLSAQESPEPFVRRATPDGIEYGLWNRTGSTPAPMLFVLAGTIESTLGKPYFRQCGNELAEHGWVCVTIDLPCHGTQAVEGQPTGLTGWSDLAARKRDFVAESNARLTRVLDHLIESGIADPERIVASGTSRGGFLAIHFAAHDTRVKCAAGFAPVTDLAALSEFRATVDDPFVATLSLESRIEQLTGRPVWIVIGDQDERVGTDRANAFAQQLTTASRAKMQDSRVELNILPEPRGHTTPPGSSKLAADWILSQFPKSGHQDSSTGTVENGRLSLPSQRAGKDSDYFDESKAVTLFAFDEVSIPFTQNLKLIMKSPERHPANPVVARGPGNYQMQKTVSEFMTSAVELPETPHHRFYINADGLGEEATLKVELLHRNTIPIPEYSGRNAAIVRASGFQTPVTWNGHHGIHDLPDSVRFRVTFEGERNTSIRFNALYLRGPGGNH